MPRALASTNLEKLLTTYENTRSGKVGKGTATGVSRGATQRRAASSVASKPDSASISAQSGHGAKGGKGSALEEKERLAGKLTVKIRDYRGETVRWDLMVILDNSESMANEAERWSPSRFRAALDFLNGVNNEMTEGSEMAIRGFSSAFSLTRDGSRFPISVSRILLNWTHCPVVGLPQAVEHIAPVRGLIPVPLRPVPSARTLPVCTRLSACTCVLTDGRSQCAVREVMSAVTEEKSGPRTVVDIILFASGASHHQGYEELARGSGGVFARLDSPSDLGSTVPTYCSVLKTPKRGQITIRDDKTTREVLPDEEVQLARRAIPTTDASHPGSDCV